MYPVSPAMGFQIPGSSTSTAGAPAPRSGTGGSTFECSVCLETLDQPASIDGGVPVPARSNASSGGGEGPNARVGGGANRGMGGSSVGHFGGWGYVVGGGYGGGGSMGGGGYNPNGAFDGGNRGGWVMGNSAYFNGGAGIGYQVQHVGPNGFTRYWEPMSDYSGWHWGSGMDGQTRPLMSSTVQCSIVVHPTVPAQIPVTTSTNPADANKVVVATHCGHLYHQVCLEKWFREQRRRSCPTCREVVSNSEVIRLYPSYSVSPGGPVRSPVNRFSTATASSSAGVGGNLGRNLLNETVKVNDAKIASLMEQVAKMKGENVELKRENNEMKRELESFHRNENEAAQAGPDLDPDLDPDASTTAPRQMPIRRCKRPKKFE